MLSKSSQNRKPTSNRVPKKWRNLPPAGHGITPDMKARPIIGLIPNEETQERLFDDMCTLMPVPINTFLAEHGMMILNGYHAVGQDSGATCDFCGCTETVTWDYAKRHRNGKVNWDWMRTFNVCPQCMHVSEIIFTFRSEDDEEGNIAA